MQAGEVERPHGGERGAAAPDLPAPGVPHPSAQCLYHARSPVGAGAAADAEDDPPAAGVERGTDHLSRAVARGGACRQPPTGEPAKPRHVRQLDHGDAVAFGVGGVDRFPGGSLGVDRDATVAGRQGRVQGPVAAVGDGHPHDVDALGGAGQARRDPVRDLYCGEGAFELVRRDHDTHAALQGAGDGGR